MSPWTYLALGILFEVVGTSALKMSDGFTQWLPSSICILGFMTALYMLSQSVRTLDISVVYAIWCGAGIVLIALIGVFFFSEVLTPLKILFIALIVIGVVGLQVVERAAADQSSAAVE
ncbi:MAG: multidrug efflux SMR transporter [Gammaproteobacteria bacterium]|nr:multidrug efflux SMR transporter [Gammaproteobacteria bacterium]